MTAPVSWTFTIPGRLPGVNEMVAANRANRFGGASQKRKATALCAEAASSIGATAYPVEIECVWIEPSNRRDIDNVAGGIKFVMDGLVEARRIPNDTRRYVRGIKHSFPPPDPHHPRVIVTVTEVP